MASINITVVDKQRGPRSETTAKYGPWKIAASNGLTYRAGDDVASEIDIGNTYDCRAEPGEARGNYPPDTFIKHAVKGATQPAFQIGTGSGDIGRPGGTITQRNGPEHGMIVKESFQQLALGKTPTQILDWWVVAEEIYERLKNPGVDQKDGIDTGDTF